MPRGATAPGNTLPVSKAMPNFDPGLGSVPINGFTYCDREASEAGSAPLQGNNPTESSPVLRNIRTARMLLVIIGFMSYSFYRELSLFAA
jgi:hypothetical protein